MDNGEEHRQKGHSKASHAQGRALLPESKVLSMKATLLSTKEGGNVNCGDKLDWKCSRSSVLITSIHSNHLRSEVTQSCRTLCNPMNCSLPGSSVHWNFQARILEWVAISFSRRSSQPRDWTQVFHIVGRSFTV